MGGKSGLPGARGRGFLCLSIREETMATTPIACVTEAGPLPADGPLSRVAATPEALEFLREIRADHGPLMLYQSGGCCDGFSPMCYRDGDFRVSQSDVRLGEIDGVAVWIWGPQFEVWKETQLILDVVPGRGGAFSLDNGRERRFLTRARLFSAEELARLDPVTVGS
jgi:uncharacterized protein (DUF779 family)